MRYISDITSATLCGRRDLENFLLRQDLSTPFEESRRGVQRRYTLDNAIEIGLCEALRRAGLKPSEAVTYTASLLRQRARQIGGMPNYLIFLDGDHTQARSTSDLDAEDIKTWAASACSVAIVSTRDVVGRAEAFFDVYGQEA